jgi:hypothetical protein
MDILENVALNARGRIMAEAAPSPSEIFRFSFDDVKVIFPAEDVAIIAYTP